MKFGVIFRLNATIILLFTHTEGTRRLRCSCTFGTDGTHKLRCSCTLVPAVHGAPWYRPPARTSGTGTGAPRLPARWYTVRTRTVCAVDSVVRQMQRTHHLSSALLPYGLIPTIRRIPPRCTVRSSSTTCMWMKSETRVMIAKMELLEQEGANRATPVRTLCCTPHQHFVSHQCSSRRVCRKSPCNRHGDHRHREVLSRVTV